MSTLDPLTPSDNSRPPEWGDRHRLAGLTIAAIAMTVATVVTGHAESAVILGSPLLALLR
jgi:putative Ca2+/H+ antiporter (TMEM165/GDT1 family)